MRYRSEENHRTEFAWLTRPSRGGWIRLTPPGNAQPVNPGRSAGASTIKPNALERHFLSVLSSLDRVQVPGPGDAFEFVLSPVLEVDA